MTNPVLENIFTRRSVRKYLPQQINQEELETIIEAGRFAPSGSNSQTTHFVVIQKPEAMEELKAVVISEFAKMDAERNQYASLKYSIAQSQKGEYEFYFKAPTLILTANLRGYGNAYSDCATALENMMLAAWSLKIGTCWVNQVRWLSDNPRMMGHLEKLGVGKNEIVCGGLALGYPAHVPSKPLERNGNPVTYIK